MFRISFEKLDKLPKCDREEITRNIATVLEPPDSSRNQKSQELSLVKTIRMVCDKILKNFLHKPA